ncbi:Crp/Fnr family transcriptional regulator [Gorillibacterium sp. sgz5001074]|uniref:Crp/Fnr family transcriptional regulator n=1 Tax=Gorillibacterium sp. sgz5001074 TaxID=3446695 RepID=UPI003F668844
MSSMTTFLKKIPLFIELDEAELERLAGISISRSYRKNANVFMEGDPKQAVFFIHKGIIKIYKIDSEGNEQIVTFLKEGEMFPHTGFFDSTPYPATSTVVEAAELFVIPIQAFEQLMLDMPTIAIKVMRVMSEKIREFQGKLQAFVTQDVNRRIVSFLVRMADNQGVRTDGEIKINIPMTHQEFANMVGTTRETVNRVMNNLKKEGIIEMNRQGIVIYNEKRLRELM